MLSKNILIQVFLKNNGVIQKSFDNKSSKIVFIGARIEIEGRSNDPDHYIGEHLGWTGVNRITKISGAGL